jgi:hypothetical protein
MEGIGLLSQLGDNNLTVPSPVGAEHKGMGKPKTGKTRMELGRAFFVNLNT